MNKDILKRMADLVDEERRSGLRDGLSSGIIVAERILAWYVANWKMKEPHPPEKLERWARDAVEELREKMRAAGG